MRCYWGVLQTLHVNHARSGRVAEPFRRDIPFNETWNVPFNENWTPHEHFAYLARAVENFAVGSPCGIMDQVACSCGLRGKLLPVWCSEGLDDYAIAQRSHDFARGFETSVTSHEGTPQPYKKRRRLKVDGLPPSSGISRGVPHERVLLPVWAKICGWPTGKKHSHSGSQAPYTIARTALFMGKALICMRIETNVIFPWESPHGVRFRGGKTPGEAARQELKVKWDDYEKPFFLHARDRMPLSVPFTATEDGHGTLRRHERRSFTPCEGTGQRSVGVVLRQFIKCLPEHISGRDFKAQYRESLKDPLSVVDDDTLYPVRAAVSFSVEASEQAEIALLLLKGGVHMDSKDPNSQARMKIVGEMMYKQHMAYSDMGLGCTETDEVVAFLRKMFPDDVYGARVGGGGCGGTVVILYNADAGDGVRDRIAEALQKRFIDEDIIPPARTSPSLLW
mgnify:CR=1 FL=1